MSEHFGEKWVTIWLTVATLLCFELCGVSWTPCRTFHRRCFAAWLQISTCNKLVYGYQTQTTTSKNAHLLTIQYNTTLFDEWHICTMKCHHHLNPAILCYRYVNIAASAVNLISKLSNFQSLEQSRFRRSVLFSLFDSFSLSITVSVYLSNVLNAPELKWHHSSLLFSKLSLVA